MDIGFETIGNATLIFHDRGPVLATDPWIEDSCYFGSWILAHEIPEEQKAAIQACKYLWISHGHPDHLSYPSLQGLRDKTILLPDHFGSRIKDSFEADGFQVEVLKDGVWTQLSDRLRVASISDYNQDAVLLADIGGRLVVNLNDAGDRGCGEFLLNTVRKYDKSFLLRLVCYGDADMINFFDEDGNHILPAAAERPPLLPDILEGLRYSGCTGAIPFSSLHKYQRADSVWTNDHVTPIEAYPIGRFEGRYDLLPAFVRYDCSTDEYQTINPRALPDRVVAPEEFGDSWSDVLDPDDQKKLREYFERFEHLGTFLDFLRFRVGGKEHVIEYKTRGFDRGITFEVPRGSLMQSLEWQIFDDLLIGNFMKTTVHGKFADKGNPALYPDFTPFIAKYGDNGLCHSAEDLARYAAAYQERGFYAPGPSPATASCSPPRASGPSRCAAGRRAPQDGAPRWSASRMDKRARSACVTASGTGTPAARKWAALPKCVSATTSVAESGRNSPRPAHKSSRNPSRSIESITWGEEHRGMGGLLSVSHAQPEETA